MGANDMETQQGYCRICGGLEQLRHVNLYVVGSEGLNLCHECEMKIVEHVRSLVSLEGKARMLGHKACKSLREEKK